MLNCSAVIAERGGSADHRLAGRHDAKDRFTTDALVLTASQSLVRAPGHALLVRAHQLELERRRAGVEHEDVHPPASVRRAAAARARARASSAVSPYAEMWPILRPGRATRLP